MSINDKEFYDLLPLTSVPKTLNIIGYAEIYVAGFLQEGRALKKIIELNFSSDTFYQTLFPLSTNITFICPYGLVFSEDWFATPIITISCQVKTT